jgi:sterol desaturase/sphingolipid hydroxylase (fatty acid hydroxylase superfamily)
MTQEKLSLFKPTNQQLLSVSNFVLFRYILGLSYNQWLTKEYNNFFYGLFQLAVCFGFEEIYTYFVHRFIHNNRTLYRFVHKMHHQTRAESFILAFYMSPLEIAIILYPSSSIGLWLCYFYGINHYALELWYIGALYFFLWTHRGISSTTDDLRSTMAKLMPDTEHHWTHHQRPNYNFGAHFLDKLFKTCYTT